MTRIEVDPFPGGSIVRVLRYLKRAIQCKRATPDTVIQPETVVSPVLQKAHVETRRLEDGNQLSEIFRGHERFPGLSIYIHGSWADNTRTAFSDLDDLIVYRRCCFERTVDLWAVRHWLNKVDMRFCRIDPLQHHGHWLIAEDKLLDCDESYIPMSVLQDSLCLQGESRITVTVNRTKTSVGLKKNVNLTLKNIARLHGLYRSGRINLYEMKCLVGSFLLMPAYLFQLNGSRVTKKHAIENASCVLTGGALKALRRCEAIRANWGKALEGAGYGIFRYLPYLFLNPHIYRKTVSMLAPKFQKPLFPELSSVDVNEFVSQCNDHIHDE